MDDTAASPAAATATAAGYDASREKATTTNIKDDGSNSVRLLIKSSNQQYDDMIIESDLCWTVQRLKKQLFLVYPGKPDINDQKLIYSGKLLDDNQKLSEVIRSYKDVYQQHNIFHLVCANKNVPKAPLKTMPKVAQSTAPTTTTTTSTPTTATGSPSTASASGAEQPNELRHRHGLQDHQRQQQIPQQGVAFDSSWAQFWQQHNQPNLHTANTNPQQMLQYQAMLYNAWMQQVYVQYMQQMNGSTSGSGLPNMPLRCFLQTPTPVVSPVATADATVAAAQMPARADDEGAAVAAAAAAGVVENERRNFPNIQEEPEMRDWLDSFFSFTRLAVFFTVLYFNSSPLRCLLVVLIAGVIYLYHIGVLRRRPERNNNNINRNNNAGNDAAAFAAVQQIQRMMDAAVEREQNDPQAANEPVAGNQQDNVDAPAAAGPAGSGPADQAAAMAAEAVVVDQPNANNSVISVVRTFVVTFFTSLLPEAPAL
ncbi:uncharacterized protein Dwil_GK15302 [Drosophila willistoni]|uniref:Ubiquitin-like domain-containing protein n=1 Tax=Drosophila willistoni TaxID=7260 RepID=B4MWK7_DROWI|nr:homocysteine-responsive endoplasmic reticulum-resident ubiquitin-like domain member 2 protein [Drosophila willistoni]EDW76148.1 uncharacterized protein Dwil_GK15302 [Drosophila willistoni]